jgi:integrase
MLRAELLGRHSFATPRGKAVHIWIRDGQYLARGRWEGRQFGKALGSDTRAAEGELHTLMAELDAGTFLCPSEARHRPLRRTSTPRLTIRQLVDEFLAEKRRLKGQATADTYSSRLSHVLAFADDPTVRRRWPLAGDIDRDFAVELRSFLYSRKVTPNGRPGATTKPMSARQIYNVLDCLRSVLHWGTRPAVGKLPAAFVNPMTPDVVGKPAAKDPVRPVKLNPDDLATLVGAMDAWQLCHLGLMCLLPCRPEEFAGLLVGDTDVIRRTLTVGTRLGGSDFTKARTSFTIPYPPTVDALVRALVGGRVEGPLFRTRPEFARSLRSSFRSPDDLAAGFDASLAGHAKDAVHTEQDRKVMFRKFLIANGGVSPDKLGKEFQDLARGRSRKPVKLYDLRHAVTQMMKDARMPHIDLLYLTSHSAGDIINSYAGVNPVAAMAAYFATVPQLLRAIALRAVELDIPSAEVFAANGPVKKLG